MHTRVIIGVISLFLYSVYAENGVTADFAVTPHYLQIQNKVAAIFNCPGGGVMFTMIRKLQR